jgi:hypothetical protein
VRVERKPVLDERQWKKFFDHTGRLAISATEVKEVVFHGVFPRTMVLMVGCGSCDSSRGVEVFIGIVSLEFFW